MALFSIKVTLKQIKISNVNQTWQKSSLVILVYSIKGPHLFPKGDAYKIAKIH